MDPPPDSRDRRSGWSRAYHWLGDSKSDRAEAHSLITDTLKFQLTPAETKAWNAWIRKGNA